jgi:uncharacterized protein YjiS (DUF1127 family)
MNTRTDRTYEDTSAYPPALRTMRMVFESFRRAQRRRATIRALSELSPETLLDIGISRSEIEAVAHEVSGSPEPSRPARRRLRTVATEGRTAPVPAGARALASAV